MLADTFQRRIDAANGKDARGSGAVSVLSQTDRAIPPSSASTDAVTPAESAVPYQHSSAHEVQRNMSLMMWDVVCYFVMVGCGEQYFSAFALELGLGDTISGWITTIPLLAGAVLQLLSPYGVQKLGSHKKWVVGCVGLQGLCLLPLIWGAIQGGMSTGLLFFTVSLYWGAGLAASSAWNAWVTGILPTGTRSHFLAQRTRVGQLSLLITVILVGLALQQGQASQKTLVVYAAIFAVACLARLISTAILLWKTEPDRGAHAPAAFRLGALNDIWRRGAAGPLLAYIWLMYAGAQIAGPFFTPYLLKDMNCSYASYMLVIGASIAAKALTMPLAGRIAHTYGARTLLIYSGLIIVPLPVLWVFSREIPYIVLLQLAAGVFWGAFELGIVLIFLEAIPLARRTNILTLYNLGFAVANVGGSLLGGVILAWQGSATEAYYLIFGLSALARVLTLPLIAWLPREVLPSVSPTTPEETLPVDVSTEATSSPARPQPAAPLLLAGGSPGTVRLQK